ncbi:VOC family protein [Halalkalibacter alkalisediminis]|uniref:VOC family protein n=1 Tax=Halalkalibacter alkalisediminis TaxID=935616 RepID=A0ABV6NH86_9BACI|nr:VOC family protein [Halalkalibacter alkalisediminis]
MIKYKELHHVSLTVSDLQKSTEFYREVLGLREIERPDFDFAGAWFEIGQQQLHLIVFPTAQTIRHDKKLSSREGHFALRVENYHEALHWLKKHDIEILEKPHSKSGFAQIFCTDPDGHLIELNVDQRDL